MSDKQMVIITSASYGLWDGHGPGLKLGISDGASGGTMKMFTPDVADEIIRAYKVDDVKDLVGKPAWMRLNGNYWEWVSPCIVRLER